MPEMLPVSSDGDVLVEASPRSSRQNKPAAPGANGWLAPDGQFYPCEFRVHDRFAMTLTHELYGSYEGTRLLETQRWIRVSNGILRWMPRQKPTRAQYDTACDLLNQDLTPDVVDRLKFSIRLMEMTLREYS